MSRPLVIAPLLALTACLPLSFAQDPVFSGPQAGEKLPSFSVKGAVGEFSGKEYDPVGNADGKPLLLIFFHEKTRPAFGMCRALSKYTSTLKDSHGLATHLILLTEDPSSEEKWAQNVIKRNFSGDLSVAVSHEGPEGPGAYGLNRNVTLTVLVAKEGKVTANYALVQPQLQADGPPILKAIADVTGVSKIPTIAELDERYAARDVPNRKMRNQREEMKEAPGRGNQARGQRDSKLAGLIRAVINKQATEEDVKQAAVKVEEYVAKNDQAKKELKRIATTVVNSGKLSNYGTKAAQNVLQNWVKRFEKEDSDKKDDAG